MKNRLCRIPDRVRAKKQGKTRYLRNLHRELSVSHLSAASPRWGFVGEFF
jgi:hypothetical protein